MRNYNKLKDIEIKQAKPREKNYTLNDGGNLRLLIKSNGHKVFEIYYTHPILGGRRSTTLGSYPRTSLKNARDKRDNYIALVEKDIDPIEYYKAIKKEKKSEIESQFNSVVNEWLAIKKKEWEASTYVKVYNLFNNFIKPFFKNKPISLITVKEISTLIKQKAIKSPETASRMTAYLNNIWIYAISSGYLAHNIIADIDKKSIIPKITAQYIEAINNTETLKSLIKDIYNYKGENATKIAMIFILHIPLRINNIVNLKWEQLDFNEKTLTIPRAFMKNKNQNLPDFKIPLTLEIVQVLQEYRQFVNSEYVFSINNKKMNPETINRALQRMGYNNKKEGTYQRTHSFRKTFRSLADTYHPEHKVSYEVKEMALDHFDKNRVALVYNFKADYLEQLKVLFTWWSQFICNLKKIEETKTV